MSRALEATAEEISDAAGELRAMERERLDRAAAAIWDQAEAGDLRAQDTWLRNRARHATLLGLDMRPEQQVEQPTIYINTRLPPEAYEVIDEDGPGELEAGEVG